MKYTFTFSEDDLRIIAAGLNELPYKVARPLVARLQRDIDEQEKAALEKEKAALEAQVKEKEQREREERVPAAVKAQVGL